jgi:uncharacterized protein YoxC
MSNTGPLIVLAIAVIITNAAVYHQAGTINQLERDVQTLYEDIDLLQDTVEDLLERENEKR